MTEEQFNFSNSFWDDTDWNNKTRLPKEVNFVNGLTQFKWLSKKEMNDFIKIKCQKDPVLKREYRIKKLNKIQRYDKDIS